MSDEIEFVKKEVVALTCGYGPVELCWMTWQPNTEKEQVILHEPIIEL